jgi:hypothetical protein
MKTIATVALSLEGLLLLLYPLAAMFALNSLGSGTKTPVTLDTVMAWSFFYGLLAYPVVYLSCLILSIVMCAKGKDAAMFMFSILPLIYLAVFMGIPAAVAWMFEGRQH